MIEKLGINSIFELVLAIICLVIGSCLWFLIGSCICPKKIKKHWIRAIISILWPVYLVCMFLSLPFITIYSCSRTPEEQEKSFKEFIRDEQRKK
jgi:hypothetical protein